LLTDELKIERKGLNMLRWKTDETLVKVKKKFIIYTELSLARAS